MDSRELEERLRRREETAYQLVIDQYSRLLWTVAGGYLPASKGFTAEDVEECVADVFVELWKHPKRFDPKRCGLKTYLCTLTKNKAVSLYRKKAGGNTVYLDDVRPAEAPVSGGAEEGEDYSGLYQAIRNLQEPVRQILIRRFFYEEKPAVIAQAMDLPVKKVENCIYRGKRALSNALVKEAE